MDEIARFPGTNHRDLSYGLKQLIAREIEVETMRHDSSSAQETSKTAESSKASAQGQKRKLDGTDDVAAESAKKSTTPAKTTSSHLQKLQAKKIELKPERRPVDFFGRQLDPETISRREEKNKDQNSEIVSSDIWFKFKEGYNNAVRRNIKIKDLF